MRLKLFTFVIARRSFGREFQSLGAATIKALSPNVFDRTAGIENEDMIHSLSEAVIDDMGVVNHPIILDDTNICDLVRTGDLNQLKVSKLKEICLQGHLETPGHQNRRKTFVDPLVNYAKRCSCQEL